MSYPSILCRAFAVCVIGFFSVPAFAQDGQPRERGPSTGWAVAVGSAVLAAPNYLGDDAYSLSAVPYIRLTNGERFVASIEEGARYTLVDTGSIRFGPRARLEFGRDEDGGGPFQITGGTDDLLGLGDVDASLSFGGFAEMDIGDFTLSVNAEQALTGHDGLTGAIGLSYANIYQKNGPPIIYSFGPTLNFADTQYMNTFFSVSAPQSLASGLPVFSASGGIVSYGANATAIVPLTDNLSATLIASYSRLSSDAAKAPLVKQRGSRDQGFLGMALAYSFE